MNDLTRITVCAVDCLTPKLAARALERSMDQCDFADALLLTDQEVETRARVEKIRPIGSQTEYSRFMLRELGPYIRTDYVLVVQWDGFVLDASQWRSGFLDFDYIGARWPWHPTGSDVGNGGFSLRSRRLLEALASPGFVHEDAPEDDLICRHNRPYLEQGHGIRFAPAEVAEGFAYENGEPQRSTFGFHGLFNLWRHLDEGQVLAIADSLPARTCLSRAFVHLLLTYLQQRKYWMVGAMYRLMTRAGDRQAVLAAYGQAMPDAEVPEALVALCEQLIQGT